MPATERLETRGLIADGTFTERGRELRERIEIDTDAQMRPVLDYARRRHPRLSDILEPWGAAIRAGKGYPSSGPHDLARMASGSNRQEVNR